MDNKIVESICNLLQYSLFSVTIIFAVSIVFIMFGVGLKPIDKDEEEEDDK